MRGWDTLFPAEQEYFERLGSYLQKAPATLFAALQELEGRMGVTSSNWPAGQFTLQQVDFLNRNPLYPEWRRTITVIFDQINPSLDATAKGKSRIILVVSPSDLPVGPDRLWTRLAGKGRRVALELPVEQSQYLPLLLNGDSRASAETSLPSLCASRRGEHSSWTIETGGSLRAHSGKATHLSYDQLAPYRRRLMDAVRNIAESSEVRGPRQLGEKLKLLHPRGAELELARTPVLAEFVRSTLPAMARYW
ncbi:MAG: hypothetical protein WKF37_17380 [Bryobacteraceae bacterium]